ncbi:myo-inosose-2 dehydratase [Aestuariispira ectoiniformans]|uniref:myo-inosose-2 dehydratase n=1 Tax=Aestuariispira ectoiniformans TaxID=2775080 RepID=UPI00223B6947|nr:myo-inosose-2 dehydratase [Aestuariispira ectoiniformans]
MTIQIGINPISWSNDDLQSLGGATPLETCLGEIKQAGYAGLELYHKCPRQPEALQAAVAPYGLKIVSGWYSGRLLERDADAEIAALQDHLNLLKAMDCQVMVWAEVTGCVHGDIDTPVSQRPVIRDEQWPEFAERMTKVADYLRDQGIAMAYHHHMGTVIETEAEVDRLMAETGPSVGLLLDTGHLVFAGGDPYATLERHRDRVVHVHCKDIRADVLARAKAEGWSFLNGVIEGVFTVPGDGSIDYQRVADILAAQDYSGWLVVEAEQDPDKANPLQYATMGHQHLEQVARKAGLLA